MFFREDRANFECSVDRVGLLRGSARLAVTLLALPSMLRGEAYSSGELDEQRSGGKGGGQPA